MHDLLFLAHRIPYPPDKGEKIRAWHIFRHLARSHRIHLGCFIDDPADSQHVGTLAAQCVDLMCVPIDQRMQRIGALLRMRPRTPLSLAYFHNRQLRRWVDDKLAAGIDRVFVFSSAMASYAMHATTARRILDMVDVDSQKWSDYAAASRFPARAIWAREARTLLAFERLAAARFDHTLFVSEEERERFVSLAPETAGSTGWVGNGVATEHFSPVHTFVPPFIPSGADLVFTGRMDYRPNIDAVRWFAQAVLPVLQQRSPSARFWIVGAAPSHEVCALSALPRVEVTGRVADTRPYLAAADVVVAPLRIARGVQNKLLEAMAMARPTVATPEAFLGVRAVPGRDVLLASGVEATVQGITDVLDGRHPGIGAAARRAVMASHQWSATLRPLDQLFGVAQPAPVTEDATA